MIAARCNRCLLFYFYIPGTPTSLTLCSNNGKDAGNKSTGGDGYQQEGDGHSAEGALVASIENSSTVTVQQAISERFSAAAIVVIKFVHVAQQTTMTMKKTRLTTTTTTKQKKQQLTTQTADATMKCRQHSCLEAILAAHSEYGRPQHVLRAGTAAATRTTDETIN